MSYIIVEGASDAKLLQRLLEGQTSEPLKIVEGGGRSSATSLARTLLATRLQPVVLVVDADTTSQEAINERRLALEELLQMASPGIPFKVVLAVPALEVIFFHDPSSLEKAMNVKLSEEDLIIARFQPQKVLQELSGSTPTKLRALPQTLSDTAISSMREHPIVREVLSFLIQVAQQRPSLAA